MGDEGADTVTAAESLLSAYARWASGIAARIGGSSTERLGYLGLGLASEAGEVADAIKRLVRDGRLDTGQLAEELGDVAYYWACLCQAIGQEPADILAASRAKIELRVAGKAA